MSSRLYFIQQNIFPISYLLVSQNSQRCLFQSTPHNIQISALSGTISTCFAILLPHRYFHFSPATFCHSVPSNSVLLVHDCSTCLLQRAGGAKQWLPGLRPLLRAPDVLRQEERLVCRGVSSAAPLLQSLHLRAVKVFSLIIVLNHIGRNYCFDRKFARGDQKLKQRAQNGWPN